MKHGGLAVGRAQSARSGIDVAEESGTHCRVNAGIAQLVERNLAKVDVAGSSPVSRSVPSNRDNKTFSNRADCLSKTLPL